VNFVLHDSDGGGGAEGGGESGAPGETAGGSQNDAGEPEEHGNNREGSERGDHVADHITEGRENGLDGESGPLDRENIGEIYREGDHFVNVTRLRRSELDASSDRPDHGLRRAENLGRELNSHDRIVEKPNGSSTRNTIDNHTPGRTTFDMSITEGAGAGIAFGLGPTLQGQVGLSSQNSRGPTPTVTGGIFIGYFGLGAMASAGPSVNLNWHTPPSDNSTPDICGASVLIVSPVAQVQITHATKDSGSPITDVSIQFGITIGLGHFGGVSCSGTFTYPEGM
jgi:hypothetical protein